MSEKRFEVIFYGDVINCVRDETGKEYNLQELINLLMDQQATIEAKDSLLSVLSKENEQLRTQLKEKEEDERLYANEILELRKTNEEWLQFKDLGGDY